MHRHADEPTHAARRRPSRQGRPCPARQRRRHGPSEPQLPAPAPSGAVGLGGEARWAWPCAGRRRACSAPRRCPACSTVSDA